MRKFVATGALVLLVLAISPTLSPAAVQVGDLIKLSNGVGSPGGIFKVDDLNDAGTHDFDTFCVEITEFINFSYTYAVEGLGTVTVNGGKNLAPKTAWLYSNFLDATLSTFNSSLDTDANALQLAIWKSIGYTATEIKNNIGTTWYNNANATLSTKTWTADFNASGWVGFGGVQIMNLRKVNSLGQYTTYAQDQLVRNPPTQQHPIPEPASVVVWSLLAACALGICAGRRQRAG